MKNLYLLSCFILLVQACYSQDRPEPEQDLFNGCCGSEPVEFTHKDSKLYIPNVFTPNEDKVNDFFYPFSDDKEVVIEGFTILSAKGDTVLFQREKMIYRDIENYGWNGKRRDGSTYIGLFRYGMRVQTKTGFLRFIEGTACAIPCGSDTKKFKAKSDCFFPSQEGAQKGSLDRKKLNGEKDCFQ